MAETVTVACKLPNGLMISVGETEQRLNGPAKYTSPQPGRFSPNPVENIIYSYGLTVVDKGLWDAWIKEHKGFKPVTSGAVYAMTNKNEAAARAKDQQGIATGLEPLDPLAKKNGTEATEELVKQLARH